MFAILENILDFSAKTYIRENFTNINISPVLQNYILSWYFDFLACRQNSSNLPFFP